VLLTAAVAFALDEPVLTLPAARARRPTIGTASAAIATATTAINTALFKFISLLLGKRVSEQEKQNISLRHSLPSLVVQTAVDHYEVFKQWRTA
jgi:hypothetical protein